MPPIDLSGDSLSGGRWGLNNPAHNRRELVNGGDLLKDRSVPPKKLTREAWPPDIKGTDSDFKEPSYHLDNEAVAEEQGPVTDDTVARGSHNHDRSYVQEKTVRDKGEDDAGYVDPVTDLNDAPWNPGGGAPIDDQVRVVTWTLAAGIQPGLQLVYARYSVDSGLTYSQWDLIGRTPPGEEQLFYRALPEWNFLPTAAPPAQAQYRVVLVNQDRSAALKTVRTGTDGKIDHGFIPAGPRSHKAAARLATVAAPAAYTRSGNTITFNAVGSQSVDGTATVLNNVVLLKDGAAGADNGLYYVATKGDGSTAEVWKRTPDADSSADVAAGLLVFVSEGATLGNSWWHLTTNDPITLNTTALVFERMGGPPTAGNLTDVTGSQVDVDLTEAADATSVDNDADYVVMIDDSASAPKDRKIKVADLIPRVIDHTHAQVDVQNDASETAFYSFTIPGGTLGSNRKVVLELWGNILQNAADALTIKVKYGSTTLYDGTATLSDSAVRRALRIQVELAAMGSTSAQQAAGRVDVGSTDAASTGDSAWAGAGIAGGPFMGAAATEVSTGDLLFSVTVKWASADVNAGIRRLWATLRLQNSP